MSFENELKYQLLTIMYEILHLNNINITKKCFHVNTIAVICNL